MVRSAIAARLGGLLLSRTKTRKLLVALKGGAPLSTTRVVNTFVVGPWASAGVQVITPLAEITALVGAESRLYVRLLAGMSASVALLVTLSVVPSLIVLLEMAANTGGLLLS